MYYVTFLLKPKVNVVTPTTWIFQYEKQWEKFVNIGLNKNQTHRVFYTKNPRAWNENGFPLPDYEVNFGLDATVYPDEGCYDGKLIKFFVNYDDAVHYAEHRRINEPATYNHNRLIERPIPQLNPDNDHENEGEEMNATDTFVNESEIGAMNSDDSVHGGAEQVAAANENIGIGSIDSGHGELVKTAAANPVATNENIGIDSNESVHGGAEQTAAANESIGTGSIDSGHGELMKTTATNPGASTTCEEISISVNSDHASGYDVIEQSAASTNEHNQADQLSDLEKTLNGTSENQQVITAESTSDGQISPPNSVKNETVLILAPNATRLNQLVRVIEEPDFITLEEGDIQITVNNKTGFAKPFNATTEGMVKRENDPISGNMPFNIKKDGARLYRVGNYNLEITESVVSTFKEWNLRADKNNRDYDQRFAHALLLSCVDIDQINPSEPKIEPEVMAFIEGFIAVRTKGSMDRSDFMKQIIQEKLQKDD